jgi:hypothetical protein
MVAQPLPSDEIPSLSGTLSEAGLPLNRRDFLLQPGRRGMLDGTG